MKGRLNKEGSQLVTVCCQLKMIVVDANGMSENESAAKTGGGIAKKARLELEGKKVVNGENYLPPAKHKSIAKK